MFTKFCYLLIVGLAAGTSVLADCDNAIPRTTPDQAFTIHGDGTVTHHATGLMWMRCLLGQTGPACAGQAQGYTWQGALQAANGFSFAGYNDWRLPNKNELASIVEYACFDPAINSSVFPNDANFFVWSSSPDLSRPLPGVWGVHFVNGGVFPILQYDTWDIYDIYDPTFPAEDYLYYTIVRLVRGGQ